MKNAQKRAMAGVAFCCLMFAAPFARAAIPSVSLELFPLAATVGDTILMDVFADHVTPVGTDYVKSFGFLPTYDATAFTFNGAVLGLGFSSLPASLVAVGGIALPPAKIGGEHVLLSTLNFTAHTEGAFLLGIVSTPLTNKNEGLFVKSSPSALDMTTSIQLNVTPQGPPVPVPGSLLLLSCGFSLLAGLRKKRRC